jgi:hypothetical protein
VLAVAVFFLIEGAFLNAVVAMGIAANCVPVLWFGIGSLRAGEPEIGLRAMLRPAARAAALREHPTMQRDTYLLAGATLLPFVVAVVVAVELATKRVR